jgi:hypothetical protein
MMKRQGTMEPDGYRVYFYTDGWIQVSATKRKQRNGRFLIVRDENGRNQDRWFRDHQAFLEAIAATNGRLFTAGAVV